MSAPQPQPAWPGYFADPFVTRTPEGWVAVGSGGGGAGVAVAALTSADLVIWHDAGPALLDQPAVGPDTWAPELAFHDGSWWMYFSIGRGIEGHHLRVARSDSPAGPYEDLGLNLTPDEPFAIDAHVFTDADGRRYLYYAHDVLNDERPGTHLAVRRLLGPAEVGDPVPVLAPNALWQRYEADRRIYGTAMDWYTLEGPTVLRRDGGYTLLFSGGSWEGPDYGVSFATAPSPLGPWTHGDRDAPSVLSRAIAGMPGPGHNSVTQDAAGNDVIVFHAWDAGMTRRQMHLRPLRWVGEPAVPRAVMTERVG